MNHRDVGEEARLHDVLLAIEVAHLLALGDEGTHSRPGVEGRDAGADALSGQRACLAG
jgi:hypothetical protein